MPIYEYQGQQYDIATDDQAAAKQKILDHLESQKTQPQPDPLGRYVADSSQTAPQEGPKQVDENAPDFTRGITNELGSLQNVYGGAKVLAGKAIGSQSLMQSGLESMKQGEAKTEVKATDNLSDAWQKGIGSVVGNWLPYQMGSGVGNILETLGFMGIGAGVGALTGAGAGALPGAVAGAVEKSLVKKGVQLAAENVLKEAAEKTLAEGATKEAAKDAGKAAAEKFVADEAAKTLTSIESKAYASNAAKNIGGNMGLVANAAMHGAGEVTQQAVEQAEKEGRAPTDIDMSRVVPAALVHGVADWFTEKIGLHALDGMAAKSSGKMIQDIAKSIALTGTKEAFPETLQEIAQRYGANMSLTDADALKDYLNTIGASYAMSVAPAGVGGVRANLAHRVAITPEEKALATKQGNAPGLLDTNGKPVVEHEETAPDQGTANVTPSITPEIQGHIDLANEKLSKLDEGKPLPAPTINSLFKKFGLEKAEGSTREENTQVIRDHIAKLQEPQSGTTSTVNGTNRSSAEVSGGEGTSGTTTGTTTTNAGKLAGTKPFVDLSEAGKGPKRATLEETVEEQKAAQNLGTEEQKPYLTTKSSYSAEAPIDVDTGINHAGHEQAFDAYDTVDYKNGVLPELKALAEAKNKEEETDKYKAGDPLAFMSEQELVDLYDKHSGKKDFDKSEATTRQTEQDSRNTFKGTLEPLQQAKVNAVAQRSFADEVLASERRKKQTTEADQRKNREKKHKEKTFFDVQQQVEEAKEDVAQRERQAQEAAEKEAREEKDLEQTAKEVSEAADKVIPKREKTASSPKERTVSKRIREITEAIKSKDITNLLTAVGGTRRGSDPMTVVIANAMDKLISRFSVGTVIQFGEVEGNASAKFDPAKNVITFKGTDEQGYTGTRPLDEAAIHEVSHSVLDHVFDNPDAYIKSLPGEERDAARAALTRLNQNYKLVKTALGNKYNIGSLKEFAAEFWSNPKFQIDLAMMDSKSTYAPKDNMFTSIAKNIARVLGINGKDSGVTFKEIAEDLARIISAPSEGITGKEVSYAANKKAEDKGNGSILPSKEKGSITEEQQPKNFKYFKDLLFTRQGWRRIAFAVQNDRQFVKHWQNINDLANRIYYEGIDKINNVYGQLVRAPAQGMNLYRSLIEGTREKLDKAVYELSKATGFDIKDTLELVHNVAVGMHDYERRLVKYLKIVPLSEKKTFTYDGKKISPAEFRDLAFNKLKDNKTTEAQARQLRQELDALVFTKNSKGELSPNKKHVVELGSSPRQATDQNGKTLGVATDINNPIYDVSLLTHDEAQQRLAEYHAFPHKKLIDDALQQIRDLHTHTTELNKMANYWSQPVSNHKEFYGWDHYVPLTGYHTEEDEGLDFNSKRMGRELQDKAYSFEGRTTESNNVVLQSMKDAVNAAARAGRKDLTQAIKNAAAKSPAVVNGKKVDLNPNGQGILPTAKVIAHFEFADRTSDEVLNALPKENTIFHYNPDGSIDVIEIGDKNLRESIRRSYTETNPMVDMANKITSTLGMMHTRYNFNFAPLNFVRDALTNAWSIGAEMGPMQSAKYIADIATRVVAQNSLGKAMKVAALYESKDIAQIEALAKKDPIIKDMHEYIQKGGMVSYMQGLSLKSNFQQLHKDLGKSGIIRNMKQLNKFVDIWNDMFELSSRSAAYAIAKQNFKGKGLSEEAASNKAVEYAKNLANFEQVGKYGKELGSVFMFFRPSATGAVRAIEAVAPAFQSIESAVKDLPPGTKPEAIATFKVNFAEHQKNARYMSAALMGLGALAYTMSHMMAGDDDLGRNKVQNDDPGQWNRFARFFTPFSDTPIQLPWGFGLGSFAAAGAQLAMVGTGHQSFGGAMGNILTQISLDSFVPIPVSRMPIQDNPALWMLDSMTPSMLRPAMEFVVNKNGLGQSIYNDANRRMGDAYLGGDNIPEIYKTIARDLFDATAGVIDWSPNSIYFLANSYADGPARVIETTINGMYLASGQAEEKDTLARAKGTPLIGSFIGAAPNVDSREFSSIENQLKEKEKIYSQAQLNPEVEAKYLEKNPLDPELIDFYNQAVQGQLKDLRKQANEIRLMPGLSPKDRAGMLKEIIKEENLVKFDLVQQFKSYGMKP